MLCIGCLIIVKGQNIKKNRFWKFCCLRSAAQWVKGSIHKKKVIQNPGPNPHTVAAIRKEVLGHHFLSQNDRFTRIPLRHHHHIVRIGTIRQYRYHTLGYPARMTPPKGGGGGIWRPRLRLI